MATKGSKLADFKQDPRNARRHTERNLAAVETSISEVGVMRPLVAAADGTIIAGNLTSEALANLGMDDVIVVESDGKTPIIHVRTDVESGSDAAIRAGLYDNLTSDLADGYHPDVLRELLGQVELSATILTSEEAARLMALPPSPGGDDDDDPIPESWMVLIVCANEREQSELLERLEGEGLSVRAIIG